jgi:hypothetical protein
MATEKWLIDVNAIPESATAISSDGRLYIAWSAIVDAPKVDVTEVVRCGVCRYYDSNRMVCKIKFDGDGENLAILENGYCSDGKWNRRAEDVN